MEQTIEYVPTDQVVPYELNARTHPDLQQNQITSSIKQFGFINPIVVDEDNVIVAGHGRYLAAKKLGLKFIPIIRVAHLTKDEVRAYRLADNKIAENAGWDNDLLMVELSYLLSIDNEFDLSVTGFSTPEIDVIVSDLSPDDFEEPIPPLPPLEQVVSRIGDIWICGDHRVGVGDIRDNTSVDSLMNGKSARMTINDSPYNVQINGHVSGKGKVHHEEFAMASGEMPAETFTLFLTETLTQLARISVDGSLHYLFMDWRHLQELLSAGEQAFDQFINLCIWTKTNGGMGSLYRSMHELCLIYKKGTAPHINNVELGRHGRNRTNVWPYAGMNSFGKDREEILACHPTVKPLRMIADAIMDVTHHGDIVFDGFLGSGTTLLAAEQTHRVCYATEIEARYVDVSLRRWMAETGQNPVLEATGRTFDEVKTERLSDTGGDQ